MTSLYPPRDPSTRSPFDPELRVEGGSPRVVSRGEGGTRRTRWIPAVTAAVFLVGVSVALVRVTPAVQATVSPSETPTPSPSPTPTPEPSPTPTPSPSPTPTPSPSPSPVPTPTPSPCPTPCDAGVDIDQQTKIIAGGNVQSKQDVTVIGQKTEQTVIQNITQTTAQEKKEEDRPVTSFKSDGRETARVGEVLTYRIVIKNPNDRDLTEVKIVDHVPPFLIPIDTSPKASANAKARTITWDNQTISATSEITFAFRARVAANAPNGFLLQNVADINGPGIHASVTDTTKVIAPEVAAAVAPRKPRPVPVTAKTGTPIDTLSLILSLSGSVATTGTLLVRRFV